MSTEGSSFRSVSMHKSRRGFANAYRMLAGSSGDAVLLADMGIIIVAGEG